MRKKPKLQQADRYEIRMLLDRGYHIRQIARVMQRSPNTISAEIRRNCVRGQYDPKKANQKARVRLKYRRHQWRKIEADETLRAYVVQGLKAGWNPDEIAGRMRREHRPFSASKSVIYGWLRTVWGQTWCRYLYSRRYYARKRKPKKERMVIPGRIGIERRFSGATHRTRYGHWEADTLVSGRRGHGGLSVAIERKSRFMTAARTDTMSADEHVSALRETLSGMRVRSVTFDNGIENKKHRLLGVPTFFCDPYSSWQKGSVENVNKLIRRYLPKGTNFFRVSPRRISRIIQRINHKPRRILGYQTAYEVALQGGVFVRPASVLIQP